MFFANRDVTLTS